MNRAQPMDLAASASPSPPALRVATFDDYQQMASLGRAHHFSVQPESDWRSLWLNNPLWPRLGGRWPIGWVMEDAAGRVVGAVVNVPSLYTYQGRELISANGRAWVVEPEYRGFALWVMDEYFNQSGADLFINTTVGPQAEAAIASFSRPVPLGDWLKSAFFITNYGAFIRLALRRARVPLAGALAAPAALAMRAKDALLARPIRPANGSVDIQAIENFDERFDAFYSELLRQNPQKLLAARDSAAMRWHFDIPMRRNRLWIFTAVSGGLMRAYLVLKRHDADEPDGMRRMRIVDYQNIDPQSDLLPPLLQAALDRCASENIYVLDHLGCELPKMSCFDAHAPYRMGLPCWPYFYHVADPALALELQRPQAWDPSVFDGDSSFE